MLIAIQKFIASFFKRDWSIHDYPLKHTHRPEFTDVNRHVIRVINWPNLIGLGRTEKEAFVSLERRFLEQVKKKGYKPRPGTKVPFEVTFAPTTILDKYRDITDTFLKEVVGFKSLDMIFVSDETNLRDFYGTVDKEKLLAKISEVFGIDITYPEDESLAIMIQKIAFKIKASNR